MTWVAGADGCKAGWVVVLRELRSREIDVRLAPRIEDVLKWKQAPKILCVDIPIGLLDDAVPGGRECDRAARALLEHPRASSVFSPPVRRTLKARNFEDALRLNRGKSLGGPGIALQAFGILPKIREVEEFISPAIQARVLEVHPEVCFYQLNRGSPVVAAKKKARGREGRVALLERAWRRKVSVIVEAHRSRTVARDDIIDAMAACWTAERVLKGREIRLPARPPRDSRGLRMEIVR